MGVATKESIRRGYVRGFCLAGLALFIAAAMAGALAWADMYRAGNQGERTLRHTPAVSIMPIYESGLPGVAYQIVAPDRASAYIELAGILANMDAYRVTIVDELRGDTVWTLIVRVEE